MVFTRHSKRRGRGKSSKDISTTNSATGSSLSPPQLSPNRAIDTDRERRVSPLKTPPAISHIRTRVSPVPQELPGMSQNFQTFIAGLWSSIPEFSGAILDDVTLEEFIDHIEDIASQVTCSEANKLFILRRKLKGEAKLLILGNPKLKRTQNFEEVVEALKGRFAPREHIAQKTKEFLDMCQKQAETVDEYATRLQTASYKAYPDDTQDKTRVVMLVDTFRKNVKSCLQQSLIAHNFTDFKSILRVAREEEKFRDRKANDEATLDLNAVTNPREKQRVDDNVHEKIRQLENKIAQLQSGRDVDANNQGIFSVTCQLCHRKNHTADNCDNLNKRFYNRDYRQKPYSNSKGRSDLRGSGNTVNRGSGYWNTHSGNPNTSYQHHRGYSNLNPNAPAYHPKYNNPSRSDTRGINRYRGSGVRRGNYRGNGYTYGRVNVTETSSIVHNITTTHPMQSIVKGLIGVNDVHMLIDSGSTVNLLYESSIDAITKLSLPCVEKPTILRAFNSNNTQVAQIVTVTFKLGESCFVDNFFLVNCPAPVSYTVILGQPFLERNRAVISYCNHTVRLPGITVPFIGHNSPVASVDSVAVQAVPEIFSDTIKIMCNKAVETDEPIINEKNPQTMPVKKNNARKDQNKPNNIQETVMQESVASAATTGSETTASTSNSDGSQVQAVGRAVRKYILKAVTESFIEVKSDFVFPLAETLLFEPLNFSTNLLFAKSVSHANKENSYLIKVANLSDEDIHINKDSKLMSTENLKVVKRANVNTVEMSLTELNTDFEAWGGKIDMSHLTDEHKKQLCKLLSKHKQAFACSVKDLTGCDTVRHQINLNDENPIRQRPYKIPHHLQGEMKKQIAELLEADIISPSFSAYNTPVLFVRKKEGSYRLCCDFRALNKITIEENFPIPNIQDMIDNLSGGRFFSTLDLAQGYYQLKLDEKDCHKTAFSTPQGHFHWNRLPFGMKNAPSSFSRLMDLVLADKAAVYIDDIVISSKTFEEHLGKLEEVLVRLETHGLKLKPSKCSFFKQSIKYLGFMVSEGKVGPDPSNIEVVEKFQIPKTPKNVRQFLGLTGFYRRFIEGYSKIALPLTNLTKKDVKFQWTEETQAAFDQLKSKLLTEPILLLPNFAKTFSLHTDASKFALGAVLSQQDDNDFHHPVAYASRKLSEPEIRYSVVEKEALGIVWACRYFRAYLLGKPFIIYCDQASLSGVMKHKDPSARIARWMLALNDFNYKIVHKPGRLNITADFLSRCIDNSGKSTAEGHKNIPLTENNPGEVNAAVDSRVELQQLSVEPSLQVRIQNAQLIDAKCNEIKSNIEEGLQNHPAHFQFFFR